MRLNRLHNVKNPYQGEAKKVLCLCSAGLLRSPTAAEVLSREPFNFNTRAAGVDAGHALIVVDDALIHWADEIVCMTNEVYQGLMPHLQSDKNMNKFKVLVLAIEDKFEFRNPELVEAIKTQYQQLKSKVELNQEKGE